MQHEKMVENITGKAIFESMIKNYLFRSLAVLVVLAMGASPVMGAACTMSCGDTRSCCCQGDAGNGETVFSAPNCCEVETRLSRASSEVHDRSYSTFSFQFQSGSASRTTTLPVLAGDRGDGLARATHAGPGPPQAPLFIVHSSFLI
jgi:hypothetical protein